MISLPTNDVNELTLYTISLVLLETHGSTSLVPNLTVLPNNGPVKSH